MSTDHARVIGSGVHGTISVASPLALNALHNRVGPGIVMCECWDCSIDKGLQMIDLISLLFGNFQDWTNIANAPLVTDGNFVTISSEELLFFV